MKRLGSSIRGFLAFLRLVRNPLRLEQVFRIVESVSDHETLDEVLKGLQQLDGVAPRFAKRSRIGSIDLERLKSLPEASFGCAFADSLIRQGLDPSSLPSLKAGNDHEYINAHLYETHDVWHALTGFGTDVAGELGLQGFYAAQVGGSLSLIIIAAGLLNTAFFARRETSYRFNAIVAGWNMGVRARPIFGVDWKGMWARPLSEVRSTFNLVAPGLRTPLNP